MKWGLFPFTHRGAADKYLLTRDTEELEPNLSDFENLTLCHLALPGENIQLL